MEPTTKQELKDILIGTGARFSGDTACTCPFHRDSHPSAGIYQAQTGAWRFKCQVCGDNMDAVGIEAKLTGKTAEDIVAQRNGRIEASPTYTEEQIREMFSKERKFKYLHEYRNEKGEITHFVACKYEDDGKKKFTQVSRYGFNFILKNNSAKNPLFRLDRIKDMDTVVMVEGEKCVLALEYIGINYATTTMGGAKNAKKADLLPLKGKRVIIWPDNDKPGKEYMDDLISILTPLECEIGTIDPNEMNLGEAEDVADYIKKYVGQYTTEELKADIEQTLSEAKTNGYYDQFVNNHLNDIISGAIKSIDVGWPCLNDSKWMLGATVTTLCAKPGVGKTWLVHNLALRAMERGIKVADIQLEDSKDYHIMRMMASILGINSDPDKFSGEDLEKIQNRKDLIEKFSKIIYTPDFDKCSLSDISELVKERATAGCKIIIVDSVSVAEKSPKNSWMDDQIFVNKIKMIVKIYKCRVILVTHPKSTATSTNREGKQITTMSLDTIAGGTAYQRLSQTILWLHDVPEGTQTLDWNGKGNRAITILKARNKSDRTASNKILYLFSHGRFNELGYF